VKNIFRLIREEAKRNIKNEIYEGLLIGDRLNKSLGYCIIIIKKKERKIR